MPESPHRGNVLRDTIIRIDPSRDALADYMGITRSYLYKLFGNPKVKWSLMRKAGDFMGHDFGQDFPDMPPPPPPQPMVGEERTPYGYIAIRECDRRVDQWKTKYLQLQEDMIALQARLNDCLSASQS